MTDFRFRSRYANEALAFSKSISGRVRGKGSYGPRRHEA
jgi:hypothetical protein